MNGLVKLSLLLVLVLVAVSAYLRLAHSGIGCPDWPGCYGHIGQPPAVTQTMDGQSAYQQLASREYQPLAWATPLHRLVASTLGILVLVLAVVAFRQRHHRLITLLLVGLTLFLASIGLKSGSLHSPAVVMGNLSGGFAMLGLLGWMLFSDQEGDPGPHRLFRIIGPIALLLLVSQILLGGFTSANFAATACQTLPDCHGEWLPGPELGTALDLSRQHQVNELGFAVGGAERPAIQITHRLGSALAFLALLAAGLLALKGGRVMRTTAVILLVLLVLEFGVGVAAVLTKLPIGLAVAHNWLAALLLLSLLKLLALNRPEH